jgi:hypothetical protein
MNASLLVRPPWRLRPNRRGGRKRAKKLFASLIAERQKLMEKNKLEQTRQEVGERARGTRSYKGVKNLRRRLSLLNEELIENTVKVRMFEEELEREDQQIEQLVLSVEQKGLELIELVDALSKDSDAAVSRHLTQLQREQLSTGARMKDLQDQLTRLTATVAGYTSKISLLDEAQLHEVNQMLDGKGSFASNSLELQAALAESREKSHEVAVLTAQINTLNKVVDGKDVSNPSGELTRRTVELQEINGLLEEECIEKDRQLALCSKQIDTQ